MDLLNPEKRTSGGFRLYRESDLFKLEIIKIFKELGFTLEEVEEILSSPGENAETKQNQLGHSQEILKNQLREVEERIQQLKDRQDLIEQGLESLEDCRNCSRESCPEHCGNRRYYL